MMTFEQIAEYINNLPVERYNAKADKSPDILYLVDEKLMSDEESIFDISGNPFELDEHVDMDFEEGHYSYQIATDGYSTWGTRFLLKLS